MNKTSRGDRMNADRRSFATRLALLYGAIFLLVGSFLPYFPVWLDWRGLSAQEIGVVLAAPLFARILFTPTISFVADRIGDRRRVLILLAWGTGLSCLLFMVASGFWAILLVTVLYALFWTTVMPLTETVAMTGVRASGLDYGRMRLWGSLTFIAASFAGGFAIQFRGASAALWIVIFASLCVVAAAHLLPRPSGAGRLRAATSGPRIRVGDALDLVRSPRILLFLLTTSAVQAAHAVYYVFGTLHWQSAGISTGVIGMLWAVGVVAEIALFTVSGRVVASLGPVRLIWLAAAASVLRWSVTAFDPPLALLFSVQLLHGLTFGAAHLGAIHYISDTVPENVSATAQGLYASVTAGIAMGAAMSATGPLYAAIGGHAYLAMAVIGAIGLAGATLLLGRRPGAPTPG